MEVSEFTDEDAADVGRALIGAIEAHTYPGWSPTQCPSEIVGDLRNECDELRHRAIKALVKVARAAWNACDDSEELDGHEHRVCSSDFDALCDALDELDELPDDQPGYAMNGPMRAEWALRIQQHD